MYETPMHHERASVTIGPRYTPEEMNLEILLSELHGACRPDLSWIGTALCSEMAGLIEAAREKVSLDDGRGGADLLHQLRDLLRGSRSPTGTLHENAYWLLDVNARHLARLFSDAPN